ncbi:hypothetical protein ACFQX7_30875 [Luedemannella flava]
MDHPVWAVADPYDLDIELVITRGGRVGWQGTASTSQLHRRLDDLVGYLLRGDVHPDGVVLSTGTCLVPPAPFTLHVDDTVQITIGSIGTLTNPCPARPTNIRGRLRRGRAGPAPGHRRLQRGVERP